MKIYREKKAIRIKISHIWVKVYITNGNPFKELEISQKKDLIKSCPGSPLYYKDYNSEAYTIAIINEFFEFQYFDRDDLLFLNDMLI